jgi:hypothetical protein
MKTQEEIEAMANDFVSLAFSRQDLYDGFINGYFQCQQDMVEKYTEQDMIKFAFDTYYQEDMAKKYTEDDMRECWRACLNFNKPAGLDSGINYSDFINSLNKQ